jgi:hypothetical protein
VLLNDFVPHFAMEQRTGNPNAHHFWWAFK